MCVSLVSTGRASDRHAHLDSELKGLQMSLRELETFLKWLQEAETTVNVLADASQREDLSQDTAHVKELRQQLEVEAVEITCVSACKRIISLSAFGNTLALPLLIEAWQVCGVAFIYNLQLRIVPLPTCARSSSVILLSHSAWKLIACWVCTSAHVCASTNPLIITQFSSQEDIGTHPLIIYVIFQSTAKVHPFSH